MFKKYFVPVLVVLSLFLYGCEAEETQSSQPVAQKVSKAGSENMETAKEKPAAGTIAVIKTNKGVIKFKFFEKDAPNTVANFIKLANSKFYDGLTFHRVVPGFVIQGGDPKGDGTGDAGYKIKAEFNSNKHLDGTVAMARAAHPDSAGSQFYICLGPQPFLDGKYTVFGQVTEGLDVVHKIAVGDKMESVTIK